MSEIKQLSPAVVNKIAAGEVIERPASVLKELIENSVDSDAHRIDVAVEKGGIELIRVTDDGCGVAPEQLPLAVASHATSKICDADDLFHVASLGFRGEALASIAAVSRLTIRSRTRALEGGAELEVVGGLSSDVVPCGSPVGTSVEVRNLFYNTPVRRKFLRTTQTEIGHCTEAFTRLALVNTQVHWTLRHNGRTIHDLPPTDDWRQRILAFFGEDLADGLLPVVSTNGPVRIDGFVANPQHTRGSNRWQYLFLNGRAIRDRSLQHALGEAYRGLIMTGRYPVCFLKFSMPAEAVDVNVHPTKSEVRFQDAGQLYSQLLGTLREKFLTTDLTARGISDRADPGLVAGTSPEDAHLASELVDWAKKELATHPAQSPSSADRSQRFDTPDTAASPSAPLALRRLGTPPFRPFENATFRPLENRDVRSSTDAAADKNAASVQHIDTQHTTAQSFSPATHEASAAGRRIPAMQVHDRYLITESPEGVVVIDQHALHERILYEQIRDKVLQGSLESQNLLVPEPVDLTSSEAAVVLHQRELLARLGVGVEPFGGETVLVSSYPAMLANLNPAEVLRDLAERLLDEGKMPEARDLLDEMLHMISCKAAIKAGDRLAPEEVDALVAQRHLVQDSHHCPHGRPTTLLFSRDELDRQFKRT